MADNTRYTTTGGERWDSISQTAYGTPFKTAELIAANPNLPYYVNFPDGIVLNIPVLDLQTSNNALLPPWKR